MKKRFLSLLLTLLMALTCTFPALAAGEDFTYAITVNGGASDTVKVGETVQVALTLTCNTGDTFNLYVMQDYVKFDPEYFSLDGSIQVYQDASSTAVFQATAQDYGNGVDRVFVNHVSTTAVKLDKTVTVMTFQLKALKTGTTTLTHEVTELSDGQDGQHSMEKKSASVTISNGSGSGGSGGSGSGGSGGGSSGSAGPTLNFVSNGGSTVADVSTAGGETVDLSAYTPTRAGYLFAGWYSDAALTRRVTSVTLTGDVTVYAKWTRSSAFTDVPDGAYYAGAVAWAVESGVTNGKAGALFAPDGACTRAETVTFLWRAMGSPEPTSAACPFADVSRDAYYCKAVLWAVEKGITKGIGAAAFRPNAAVTRAQVVTFLWRAAGSPAAAAANPFTDVGSGLYYTDAVVWAVREKIALGTTAAAFSPAQTCTRAQIVTFLWRQLGK